MIADELVDEDDFIVDASREGVRLREQMIFGVVFYGADEGGLLFGRKGLVVGDFLEAGERSGLSSLEM